MISLIREVFIFGVLVEWDRNCKLTFDNLVEFEEVLVKASLQILKLSCQLLFLLIEKQGVFWSTLLLD